MRTESSWERSRAAITCPTADLRTHPWKQITPSRVLTADISQRVVQPQGKLQSCLGKSQGLSKLCSTAAQSCLFPAPTCLHPCTLRG